MATTITTTAGQSATFSASASGSAPFSYQWQKDGMAIAGANTATYSINSLANADAGDYAVEISNFAGSATSNTLTLTVNVTTAVVPPSGANTPPVAVIPPFGNTSPGSTTPGSAATVSSRIVNMSARSVVDSSAGPFIIGFNMTGGAKDVLIRATGPALAAFGLSDVLADPTITLYSGTSELGTNDNWGTANAANCLTKAFQNVGAFSIADINSKDSALLANIDGPRTVVVKSTRPLARGVVLVEVYDKGSGNDQRLANVSVRNYAGTGSDSLIIGFVIGGTGSTKVLIRGIGPGLGQFNVTGALPNPKLELHNTIGSKDTLLAVNSSWQDEPEAAAAFAHAGAFPLSPASKDAALVTELPAGAYTVILSSTTNTNGIALLEVYELR